MDNTRVVPAPAATHPSAGCDPSELLRLPVFPAERQAAQIDEAPAQGRNRFNRKPAHQESQKQSDSNTYQSAAQNTDCRSRKDSQISDREKYHRPSHCKHGDTSYNHAGKENEHT